MYSLSNVEHGLCFSYIPDMYLGKQELADREQGAVDSLNAEVLHQLKAKDTAFSMGMPTLFSCFYFVMNSKDTPQMINDQ